MLSTKASLIFISFNFLLQLFITVQIFTQKTIKSTQVIDQNALQISVPIILFELKILGLFVIFYLVFGLVQKSFSSVFSCFIPALIYFYSFLVSSFLHPQVFDDIRPLAEMVRTVHHLLSIESLHLVSAIFLFFVGIICWNSKKTKSSFISLLFLVGLSGYSTWCLMGQNKSAAQASAPKDSISPKKKSILILSVDSLNSTFNTDAFESAPALKRFFEQATHFENVITTQSQTHVSLASLLSEKTPQESGLRRYLNHEVTKDKEYFVGPVLKDLKNAGYQLGLLMDGQAFVLFERNNYFDLFFTPSQGLQTFVYPAMLRSHLFWLFLNNKVGEILFPEIKYNSEFSSTYDVRPFTEFVADNVEKLIRSDRPFFLFVHTCFMHWPGAPRYPYYTKKGNTHFPFYSYDSLYSLRGPLGVYTPEDWKIRRAENESTYQQLVKQSGEEFVEPILEKIEALGAQNSVVVALTSDHGEDLWTDQKYPVQKTLTHVSHGLFGARSNRVAFYLRDLNPARPQASARKDVFSITKSMRIFQSAAQGEYQYDKYSSPVAFTEGPLFFASYPGPFITIRLEDLAGGMRFNRLSRQFFFEADNEMASIQQVRSVQNEQFQFSVYTSNYGFQYFLCDTIGDRHCQQNLAGTNPQLERFFLKEFNTSNQIDINSDLYPKLAFDVHRVGFLDSEIKDNSSNHWLLLLKAHESFYKYFNIPQSKRLINTIANSGSKNSRLLEKLEEFKTKLDSVPKTDASVSNDREDGYYHDDIQYNFMDVLEVYFTSEIAKLNDQNQVCTFLKQNLNSKQLPRRSFDLLLKKLDQIEAEDNMEKWAAFINEPQVVPFDNDLILKDLIRARWFSGHCGKVLEHSFSTPISLKMKSLKGPGNQIFDLVRDDGNYRLSPR